MGTYSKRRARMGGIKRGGTHARQRVQSFTYGTGRRNFAEHFKLAAVRRLEQVISIRRLDYLLTVLCQAEPMTSFGHQSG